VTEAEEARFGPPVLHALPEKRALDTYCRAVAQMYYKARVSRGGGGGGGGGGDTDAARARARAGARA
jgi:hypothetical protein